MKFTLKWLKEHLDTDASLEQICDGLFGIGLEVEGVENPAAALGAFTVCRVKEARQHPNADRLRVCDVETKDGLVQVVCGAPNARTGLVGIFAAPGTHVPGTGVDLEVGTIRGVESAGMLCSERELMLSDAHDGIIDLTGDYEIGMSAAQALGLDDPVIDVAITPNRPDALGVYGIARDLAAKGLGTLKPLQVPDIKGSYKSPVNVELRFNGEEPLPCAMFVGRHVKGARNGPSPDWLQARLRAIGLRPISALVDITNYITFGYGRPLHVFDANKVHGTIHARLAKAGESLLALDGKEYTLDSSMTVIADDNGPEGIAGIIGGEVSGCDETTTDVFIEAAYFDPVRTAATGRKLGVITDARYRFERGVDPAFVETGAQLCTQMILDLCGGEPSELVIAGEAPLNQRSFGLRKNRVRSLGGIDVPVERQVEILTALGFKATDKGDVLDCAVPSWRPDIHGEADLVEEVCRIAGLDNVPPAAMPRLHAVAQPVLTVRQKRMLATRRLLAARGLNEAVTWSFLPEPHAKLFGGGQPELKLANPISSELSDMRPSLLPNLIAAVGRNLDRGQASLALYEVGQAYAGDQPQDETLRAAGVRRGASSAVRNWAEKARAVDLYDAKADLMAALDAAGAPVASVQVVQGAPEWFHPGRAGTVQLGPKNQLGWFGEVHPRILREMDVKGPLVAFEMVIDNIPEAKKPQTARPGLPAQDLLPVKRDFAFVGDAQVAADKFIRAAKGADKALITDVTVFDVFAGGNLGEGQRSIALEVTLQPKDRTLTDEDIDAVSKAVVAAVTKATGATLRG
jgi:phenylalanyl-tRNA synthetase beta chain